MNYIELTLYSVRVQKVLPIMRERSLISFSLNRTSTLPFGKIQSKNHCAKNINGERKTVKNTSVLQLAFVISIFHFAPNVKATYSICHRVRPVRCIMHCFHYTTKFNINLMLKFIPWIKYNFLFHSQDQLWCDSMMEQLFISSETYSRCILIENFLHDTAVWVTVENRIEYFLAYFYYNIVK